MQRILILAGLLACLAGAAVPARAADLDAPYLGSQQFPEDKVEFGSGWYIRGDLGATRLPSVTTRPPGILSNGEAFALARAGVDPQLVNDHVTAPSAAITNGSALGYTASLGAGYQVTPWFRTDVIADFHKPIVAHSNSSDIFCQTGVYYPSVTTTDSSGAVTTTPDYSGVGTPATGDCTGNYSAKLSSYDVLVNGYFDLGTWYRVTPYVGAGVGVSFGHYQTTSTYVQGNGVPYHITYSDPKFNSTTSPNFDRTSSGTYYNFAWALMGGFSVDVYDHTKLDIGYRYLNLGSIPGVSGTLTSQEVRAGIRYMIDN